VAVEGRKTRGLETELDDFPAGGAVQSVARGRTLSAAVSSLSWNPDLFEIVLTVSSLPASPPLAERELVKFHLQSTFTQPDVTVEASGGVATLTRYALGAFLVSAEIPAEGVTLALDLAQVADAPDLFKRR
jgi:pYEATS domain-containing protein involved in immunity